MADPILTEGQYSVGGVVFGANTMYPVRNFDPGAYDVNVNDWQMQRSDELRMGQDYQKPGGCLIEMAAMRNRYLPNMAGLGRISEGSVLALPTERTLLGDIAREWRSDDIRFYHNYMKPLRYHRDGLTRRMYGRPRRFATVPGGVKSEWTNIVADFQRIDSIFYSDAETIQASNRNPASVGQTLPVTIDQAGDGPSWFKAYLIGPIASPVISLVDAASGTVIYQIVLDYTLGVNEVVEINAYPWERRIVSSTGANLSAKLAGVSPYMNEMRIPTTPAWINMATGTPGSTAAGTSLVSYIRDAFLTF